jgi:2-methylisocitrate lyase-like PEP mutase family enzyme
MLRALHVPGRPLVVPNAWDATSALLVERAGFRAVATSSAALVAALGYEDGDAAPPEEVFAAIGRISRVVSVPVTADIESGYGLAPEDIATCLLEAGAVGCNFEDGSRTEAEHVERIAAGKAAARALGVELVVNARIDSFLTGSGIEDAVSRGRAYRDAGADCVFPIFADEIGRFIAEVGGVVNAITSFDNPNLHGLAEVGVARISFGPGLARAANATVEDRLEQLREYER